MMASAPLPEFFRGTSQALRSEAGALALGAGLIEASLHYITEDLLQQLLKLNPKKENAS